MAPGDVGILKNVNTTGQLCGAQTKLSRMFGKIKASPPAGMSLMTQVGGVLKTIAKDFNIAALVRIEDRCSLNLMCNKVISALSRFR